MKILNIKAIERIIIVAFFTFSFNKCYCQKQEQDNFLKISKSYLKYMTSKKYINKENWILILGTTPMNSDTMMFIITIRPTSSITNLKYEKVFKLNEYKLVIIEHFDSTKSLSHLFQPAEFENFNKGLNNGVVYENFQEWHFLMNKRYEVLSGYSALPPKQLMGILKRDKIKVSKDFKCY